MRVLLFWLLWLPLQGFAQEKAPEQKRERPSYTLKIAPGALLNFFQQALVIQADIPLSPRWGIDMGAGFVFNSVSFASFKDESYRGLKLRPSLKYYTKQSGLENNYVGLMLKYNNLSSDRYVNVIRQGGQYTEWMLQRRHFITYGVSIQLGTQEYFGKRQRCMIEPFFALGVRYLKISRDALPPDAELIPERNFFDFERQPGNYRVPDLTLGFYLGGVL